MENKSQRAYSSAVAKIKSGKRIPLLRVIRLKCLDCCCWQENEVKLCPADDCVLHAYRMGKNPVKRILSKKQKAVLDKLHKRN